MQICPFSLLFLFFGNSLTQSVFALVGLITYLLQSVFKLWGLLRVHFMQLVDELFMVIFWDKCCLFGIESWLELAQVFFKDSDPFLQSTLFDLGDLLDQMIVRLTDLTHELCLFDFNCLCRYANIFSCVSVETKRIQIWKLLYLTKLRRVDQTSLFYLLL